LRKLAILATALVAMFATAAVALAQSNGYDVTASTSPAKAGSKKKPVAVKMRFGIDASGLTGRPVTSEGFEVGFGGIRTNGRSFKTCSAAKINAAQSDKGCSKAAKVGSGHVHNLAGASGNPADTSITCDLNLTIYNAGNKRAALFLQGGPGVAGASCPIGISQAIDARFVRIRGGEALSFQIPSNLRHPITGLDNGIVSINATVLKKTAKVGHGRRAHKVGYFEAVGGCKRGKRAVTLTLTSETGAKTTSAGAAKC
jgi:hypothetical protein